MFAGAINLTNPLFAEGNAPISITSLSCDGSEEELSECSLNTGELVSCGRFEDAGIVCQGVEQ